MSRFACSRRNLLAMIAATAAGIATPAIGQDGTRSKTMRVVVPFPPGGSTDSLARILGPRLGQRLSETVVVDNKAGAGGNIGASLVAAEPSGSNTVLIAATSVVINPTIQAGNSPFQIFTDLVPVSRLVDIPCAILVGPSVNAASLRELIDLAKSRPDGLNMASAGFGTVPHVAGELLKSMSGGAFTHVPHKGQSEMLRELIGGRIDVAVDLLAGSLQHIQSGRLRALAVTSANRQEALPDVPTAEEAGLTGYVVSAHQSMWAPGSTPRARLDQLNKAVAEVLRDPEVVRELAKMMMSPTPGPIDEAERFLKAEVSRWGSVVQAGSATAK